MADTILKPDTPCSVRVTPDDHGGVHVALFVPTYSGGVTLHLAAERSPDGDWRVYFPWPDGLEDEVRSINDGSFDASGGIGYLGAPDVPVEAAADEVA